MDELDITECKAAFNLIKVLAGQLPHTPEASEALRTLQGAVLELEAWKKLKDPMILQGSLLAGQPAKLSNSMVLHLAGAGECSNAGKCIKKADSPSALGVVAEPPKLSSLTAEQARDIEAWLGSEEGRKSMADGLVAVEERIAELNRTRRVSLEVMRRPIV